MRTEILVVGGKRLATVVTSPSERINNSILDIPRCNGAVVVHPNTENRMVVAMKSGLSELRYGKMRSCAYTVVYDSSKAGVEYQLHMLLPPSVATHLAVAEIGKLIKG
jgi:hypothetical protein